ncbi:dihydrodipicolinate synthase family protein [Maribacter sp. 2307ULW6-5]|uniref:dihydrodipicolinate synthase family protein n=1 Tax=Maribacter sp. 2307ULW6-5 TaxID=3386275 RepID=UPI0039BD7183
MHLELKGIIPPMVTPLTKDKKLDDQGLQRLIEHLISGGVNGIFLLGSNGEAPSLSYGLRKELVVKACRHVDKRVPVLVGITDASLEACLEMANHAKTSGADVVVVAPPYYFPITEAEMLDYLNILVPQLPLPFLLYNIPSCTKMQLSVKIVERARKLGALGIKDSSGDIAVLHTFLETFAHLPQFVVFTGTEAFLPETMANGGHGAIAGGANFFPAMFVQFYEACIAGDKAKIIDIGTMVNQLYHTVYSVGKYGSRYTMGIKCAVSILGICGDEMAPPFKKFSPRDRKRIKDLINGLKKKGAN